MTFEDVQNDLYSKLQRRFLILGWIGAVVVFTAEILILLAFLRSETLIDEILHYIFIRIVLPTFINFGLVIVNTVVYNFTDKDKSVNLRNLTAIMSIFGICASLSIFHNYYFFLLVAPAIPLVLCTLFARPSLVYKVGACNFVVYILSCITFWMDRVWFIDDVYKVTTVFSCAVFLLFIFGVTLTIVKSQAIQIEFIYNNYKRQSELIEELKIEPLTHLYNRTAFNECMDQLVRNAQLGFVKPWAAMIDIDYFKRVNDTYGHANGDSVLVALSAIIREHLGTIRRAFRYGGEEFIIIFDNENKDSVYEAVSSIKDSFEKLSFSFSGNIHFTLSAGIALYKKGQSGREWIDEADIAMYRSKKGGRNKITIAD